MRKVILDTDILSEIYKGADDRVVRKAEDYLIYYDKLSFTSVTAGEILYGLYARDAKKQVEEAKAFLRANEEIIPLSPDYWMAAEIRAALKKSGRHVGTADTLIAACAITRQSSLITGNTKHYRYVIDAGFQIDLVDWRAT